MFYWFRHFFASFIFSHEFHLSDFRWIFNFPRPRTILWLSFVFFSVEFLCWSWVSTRARMVSLKELIRIGTRLWDFLNELIDIEESLKFIKFMKLLLHDKSWAHWVDENPQKIDNENIFTCFSGYFSQFLSFIPPTNDMHIVVM